MTSQSFTCAWEGVLAFKGAVLVSLSRRVEWLWHNTAALSTKELVSQGQIFKGIFRHLAFTPLVASNWLNPLKRRLCFKAGFQ